MTKQQIYEITAAALAPLWEQDAQMLESDPDRWQAVRDLDDELVVNRENSSMSVTTYRMKCLQLHGFYQLSENVRAS